MGAVRARVADEGACANFFHPLLLGALPALLAYAAVGAWILC